MKKLILIPIINLLFLTSVYSQNNTEVSPGYLKLPVYADLNAISTAIPNPFPGLIVYNQSTHSTWYYGNGSWQNMALWLTTLNDIYNTNIGNVNLGGSVSPTVKLNVLNPNGSAIIGQSSFSADGNFGIKGSSYSNFATSSGVYGLQNLGGIGVKGESNSGIGVLGISNTGSSGSFENSNSANTSNTLSTTNIGSNYTFYSVNAGTGGSGRFGITNISNINSAILVETNGVGYAGYFRNTNASNSKAGIYSFSMGSGSAVLGSNQGSGVGIEGYVTGTGAAGIFTIFNSGSSTNAIEAYTNGSGNAAYLNSDLGNALITDKGNVGIGTNNPTAKLEINGFTKLGSDAPKIKTKKLSVTSPAVNGISSFAHGLTDNKIIGVQVLLDYGSGRIPPSYIDVAGYEYNIQVQFGNIVLINKNGNSASIGGKPVTIFITYEE